MMVHQCCQVCEQPIECFDLPLCGGCARRFLASWAALPPVRNPDHTTPIASNSSPVGSSNGSNPTGNGGGSAGRVAWLQGRLRQRAEDRSKKSLE